MILISVDLPAPFSPTRAWTSPGSSAKSTPARAVAPPKVLVMPSIRSRGASGMGHGGSVSLVEELCGVGDVEEAIREDDARGHILSGKVALERGKRQGTE